MLCSALFWAWPRNWENSWDHKLFEVVGFWDHKLFEVVVFCKNMFVLKCEGSLLRCHAVNRLSSLYMLVSCKLSYTCLTFRFLFYSPKSLILKAKWSHRQSPPVPISYRTRRHSVLNFMFWNNWWQLRSSWLLCPFKVSPVMASLFSRAT